MNSQEIGHMTQTKIHNQCIKHYKDENNENVVRKSNERNKETMNQRNKRRNQAGRKSKASEELE